MSEAYDEVLQENIATFDWNEEYSLFKLAELFEKIMDDEYRYRCVIYYTVVAPPSELGFSSQLQKSYEENVKKVRDKAELFVSQGLLVEALLEEQNYEVFLFQHLSVFTNWVMTIRTYQREEKYEREKQIYLFSILMGYYPYFTERGREEFRKLKAQASGIS